MQSYSHTGRNSTSKDAMWLGIFQTSWKCLIRPLNIQNMTLGFSLEDSLSKGVQRKVTQLKFLKNISVLCKASNQISREAETSRQELLLQYIKTLPYSCAKLFLKSGLYPRGPRTSKEGLSTETLDLIKATVRMCSKSKPNHNDNASQS